MFKILFSYFGDLQLAQTLYSIYRVNFDGFLEALSFYDVPIWLWDMIIDNDDLYREDLLDFEKFMSTSIPPVLSSYDF